MDWREIVERSSAFLDAKKVPEAATAAEFLACRLLQLPRSRLFASFQTEASEKHICAMRRALGRLVAGEPLQYVLGEWDFRSLTLKCDRRALIPRPETEQLVSRVLAALDVRRRACKGSGKPFIVDVGTGTGAIVLSLAKEYPGQAVLLGTDISESAIALAKENAEICGLADKVGFAVMDGLDDFDEPECVDIIVSNPPYIESAVCETLDPRVKDFEPRIALDGGARGLDFYERYLGDALNVLKSGGEVFFEIGENQGAAVADMMRDYGFGDIRIEKDFSGHDRYAMARL